MVKKLFFIHISNPEVSSNLFRVGIYSKESRWCESGPKQAGRDLLPSCLTHPPLSPMLLAGINIHTVAWQTRPSEALAWHAFCCMAD